MTNTHLIIAPAAYDAVCPASPDAIHTFTHNDRCRDCDYLFPFTED